MAWWQMVSVSASQWRSSSDYLKIKIHFKNPLWAEPSLGHGGETWKPPRSFPGEQSRAACTRTLHVWCWQMWTVCYIGVCVCEPQPYISGAFFFFLRGWVEHGRCARLSPEDVATLFTRSHLASSSAHALRCLYDAALQIIRWLRYLSSFPPSASRGRPLVCLAPSCSSGAA